MKPTFSHGFLWGTNGYSTFTTSPLGHGCGPRTERLRAPRPACCRVSEMLCPVAAACFLSPLLKVVSSESPCQVMAAMAYQTNPAIFV